MPEAKLDRLERLVRLEDDLVLRLLVVDALLDDDTLLRRRLRPRRPRRPRPLAEDVDDDDDADDDDDDDDAEDDVDAGDDDLVEWAADFATLATSASLPLPLPLPLPFLAGLAVLVSAPFGDVAAAAAAGALVAGALPFVAAVGDANFALRAATRFAAADVGVLAVFFFTTFFFPAFFLPALPTGDVGGAAATTSSSCLLSSFASSFCWLLSATSAGASSASLLLPDSGAAGVALGLEAPAPALAPAPAPAPSELPLELELCLGVDFSLSLRFNSFFNHDAARLSPVARAESEFAESELSLVWRGGLRPITTSLVPRRDSNTGVARDTGEPDGPKGIATRQPPW